jgi:hypothetical protein
MNLNQLAKAICKIEGGKINLTIAQVKEVINCLGIISFHNPYVLDSIFELGVHYAKLDERVQRGEVKPTASRARNKNPGKAPAKCPKKSLPTKSGKGKLAGGKPRGVKA